MVTITYFCTLQFFFYFRYGGGASLVQPIRTTINHFRQNPAVYNQLPRTIYSPVRQTVVNTAFPVHGAAYGAPTRRFGRFRGRRFPRRFAGRGRGGLRSSRFGNSFRTARFDNQPFRNSRFDNAQLGRFGLGVQY